MHPLFSLSPESNGRPILAKYFIRYLIYEDTSRQRAWLYMAFGGDDKMISDLTFGESFAVQRYHPVRTEPITLTVANRPQLRELPHPTQPEHIIPIYDVHLVTADQWEFYCDLEEINWEVEIIE